jgi:diadenosine tetraphosphatase ApaH/serine/threonine PP2A family protein phosphatase
VLASLDADQPADLWCLGDLVGYGPRPNECCTLVAERASVCLVGNHDLGVLGHLDLDDFSYEAAATARWTAEVLEEEPRAFLESLEPQSVQGDTGLYHASPRDPIWEYVLTPGAALGSLGATEHALILVGHSHVALRFGVEQLVLAPCEEGTTIDLARERWLLNPGSVGQPRDGDRRAAYLMLDFEANRAEYRRVDYPVERTQEEIRAAGLPDILAERLAHGL